MRSAKLSTAQGKLYFYAYKKLLKNYVSVCMKISFVSVRFIIIITQFRIAIATEGRELTSCMNVSFVVGHEREKDL
jgi:hypothetical protein